MTDPAMMEGMMGAMKGNVAMMVPQTLIMGWINAFFAGFVLRKCSLTQSMKKISLTRWHEYSEASIPFDTSVQIDVAIWSWH